MSKQYEKDFSSATSFLSNNSFFNNQKIVENKKENIDPISEEKEETKEEPIIETKETGRAENIKEEAPVPPVKEIKEEPLKTDIKQKEIKEQKKPKKEVSEPEQVMTERKTGKQRKSELFTRHTIIVRKEYLRFFQAMSRLNDNISLTDTLDAIFKYVIDNMTEEDVKKVKKKMNERLDIFNTLKLNEE